MKRFAWLCMLVFLLAGCSSENKPLERGLAFRSRLLSAQGCQFGVKITADYGDTLHVFSADCRGDSSGALSFRVMEPETLSGISGTVSDTGGMLTFEDTALSFPLLADDQLSPVSAPWIFLKTLRSGYLTSACFEENLLRLTIDDSYEEDSLQLDIWMKEDSVPVRADILYDGKRILSLEIENFAFL